MKPPFCASAWNFGTQMLHKPCLDLDNLICMLSWRRFMFQLTLLAKILLIYFLKFNIFQQFQGWTEVWFRENDSLWLISFCQYRFMYFRLSNTIYINILYLFMFDYNVSTYNNFLDQSMSVTWLPSCCKATCTRSSYHRNICPPTTSKSSSTRY